MPVKGIFAAIGAFVCWGGFPLYWQLLTHVGALEILMHRIVWSCVFMVAWVSLFKGWHTVKAVLKDTQQMKHCLVAAILVAVNWGIYIDAVNDQKVVETSLGYYIGPLFTILIGMLFFNESLRKGQWIAVFSATLGVAYLIYKQGYVPLSALGVASSFALYGAVKKQVTLSAANSLLIESLMLFIPALGFLLFSPWFNEAAFTVSSHNAVFLICGGIITAIPLLLFGFAAQTIPLSILGFIQYIGPTLQLAVGVFLLNEHFDLTQLVGFSLVWLALVILTVESRVNRHLKTDG